MSDAIFIGVNKTKLRIQALVLGVAGVVVLIVFFYWADNQEMMSPLILKGIGGVSTFFLIIGGGAKAKRLKDKNAGLLINKEGVHDKTSEIGVGLIEWNDIKAIDKKRSLAAGLLLIDVKKEQSYIKKAKNTAIARLLKQNIRLYDTPVAIDAKHLDCKLEDLIDKVVGFRGNS